MPWSSRCRRRPRSPPKPPSRRGRPRGRYARTKPTQEVFAWAHSIISLGVNAPPFEAEVVPEVVLDRRDHPVEAADVGARHAGGHLGPERADDLLQVGLDVTLSPGP